LASDKETKMRVAALVAGLLVAAGHGPAAAQSSAISWSVVNNFGLLAGADAQKRFRTESDAYIACMRREYSPGACANGRSTFGLTQQPYPVRFQPKTLAYDQQLLHPTAPDSGDAADHVSIELSLAGATASARCDWTVGTRTVRNTSCKSARAAVALNEATPVVATVRGKAAREVATTVKVRRVVIASFGDSFMSGEGNPHIRSQAQPVKAENWLEPRCHRSLMTSSALASMRWAEANRQTYVAYYSFACSGSTAEVGLLGPYEGILSSRMLDNLRGQGDEAIHFRGKTIPSQIEQARTTWCGGKTKACVAPDVIFLSIGINSLKFSETITDLGKRACDAKCLSGLRARMDAGIDALRGNGPDALRTAYQTLARELAPKAAFALEYPDPTRDDQARFCDNNALFPSLGRLAVGRIDATENAWAHDVMLNPLNEAVDAVVSSTPGWRSLKGSIEATRRHGFCSKQRMFNSGQDARGTSGTLHPNAAGHHAIAGLLLKALNDALASAE
jgi:lysophospholipase L1-like esterase